MIFFPFRFRRSPGGIPDFPLQPPEAQPPASAISQNYDDSAISVPQPYRHSLVADGDVRTRFFFSAAIFHARGELVPFGEVLSLTT